MNDTSQPKTLEQLKERLAEVDQMIADAPYWGGYVAALGEEQRGLKRAIAARKAEVDG